MGGPLCLDGKTARGSAGGGLPGVRLLAAYAPHASAVVARIRAGRKADEHKAALKLLGVPPLEGKAVTGDAMFCQKDVRAALDDGGGDYLLAVKGNQPTLHFDTAGMLAESSAFSPLPTEAVGV